MVGLVGKTTANLVEGEGEGEGEGEDTTIITAEEGEEEGAGAGPTTGGTRSVTTPLGD